MSQTISNPLVASQISLLKSMVAAFRTAGDQIDLGIQGKAAFTTLDAIVEEVEALAALALDTGIDSSLITGNTIDQETMEQIFGGKKVEARIESLESTVGQVTHSLSAAAEQYFRDLREKHDAARRESDNSDLASADEILDMARGTVAGALAEQVQAFAVVVKTAVGFCVTPRMTKIADALKNFKS